MTTARPWPQGTAPTAAQLLDYLRALTTDDELDDARVSLDRLLTAAARAERCALMDHDGLAAEHHRRGTRVIELEVALDRMTDTAARYRLAWLSARRRAADPFHAIGILNRARDAVDHTRRKEDPDAR